MMNEHFYINRICKPNADGTIRRYHESKAEWGMSRLLSLDVFNDIFMGYLVDDCCISGSEVFVIKYNNRNDHISLYLKVADTTSLPFGWEMELYTIFIGQRPNGGCPSSSPSTFSTMFLWDISLMTVAYSGQNFSSSNIVVEWNACPW
ncbi:hypothetical protein GOBAR_AA05823 [Gossypium barbadense]|uniref:MATH domain-containing protein n=1 Tax=Gossypium barbadense TaxID=3634 RepID=A0A2P5YGP5_GOSBA|nr:hypothetical protein GOBAR_AA05823 [Gossypium barbadense]